MSTARDGGGGVCMVCVCCTLAALEPDSWLARPHLKVHQAATVLAGIIRLSVCDTISTWLLAWFAFFFLVRAVVRRAVKKPCVTCGWVSIFSCARQRRIRIG